MSDTDERDDEAQPPGSEVEEPVRQLFRQGRFADAVPVIHEHLQEHPDDAAAYELMADALRYSSDKPGAAAALTRASEVWAKEGRTIESIAAQKKAVKLGVDPDFSKVRPAGASAVERVPTPLFDELSDEEFVAVAEVLDSVESEEGDAIVTEGEPGDSMFVIVRGRVAVSVGGGDDPVSLAELGPGDFFGESALLSGRPRTATIRALAPTECLSLSRDAFETLAASHPRMREIVQTFNARRAESTVETLIHKKRGGIS